LTSAPHVVADTIEGWADAALALVSAYFGQGPRPEFDYSAIRPKGAPLKTTGGRAPGPAQLALSLAACERVIVRAIERGQQRLAPIDVHDLNCHLADCVAAGGIRRSAMIALFSPDDHALLSCKSGDWWADNGQRARANNSAVLLRSATSRADFDVLMDACRDSHAGEPGIFWTHDLEIGTNPCAEISLRHRQFCNLATINAAACITQSDLEQACAAASTIATYQATLTDFVYIADEWRSVTESDALIAVSMTGIADNPAAYASWDLERAARVVVDTNRRLAAHLGIRPSARCTTGKPDGTSSLVLGCASGIHARHGAHYVRTMRFGADESIAQHLSLALPPELVEVDRQKPDGLVIGFPECAPVGSILRDEPALDLLTRTARQNLEWIKAGHNYGLNHNNQSVTVSLREHEWVPAREWLWDNRESYTGMAILPYDGGTYEQAPFQSISEARYHELMALMPLAIDLTQIVEDEDNTALVGEAACAGGACEIPQCAPQLPHAAYEVTA
jgi:ribonucleoside-diphosphate reductase alpha chain